jgi:hypothetical protein
VNLNLTLTLTTEALRIGLQLNAGKSYLLNAALTESPTGTAFSSTGVTTLGNGFGTDDYQRLTAVSTLQKHAKPLPYLRALKPQVVLPLLQACVNARPVYLARTTSPWLTSEALQQFDVQIDSALLDLCGSTLRAMPEHCQIVRALPGTLGGLAIQRLASVQHAAYTASFIAANAELLKLHPLFVDRLQERSPCLSHQLTVFRSFVPHYLSSDNSEDGLKMWQRLAPPAAVEVPLVPVPLDSDEAVPTTTNSLPAPSHSTSSSSSSSSSSWVH